MTVVALPGKLYGVGMGPGDPQLLTLKAVRIIQSADVLAVPVSRQGDQGYAFELAAPYLRPGQWVERLLFPMVHDVATRRAHRRAAAEGVLAHLAAGRTVAFLTEGDPTVHSTFLYILAELPEGAPVEIVPGVSAITAAAAQAGAPLVNGDQRLAVLPAVFEEDEADLRAILETFDTVVFLKAHRQLDRLVPLLDELGLADRAIWVERATHPAGRVVRDVRSLIGARDLHYLSLLIVRNDRPDAGRTEFTPSRVERDSLDAH
ncbi:MAG: precorrin-2 C(20)-methyltransferase [Anaerolineae bacterium]